MKTGILFLSFMMYGQFLIAQTNIKGSIKSANGETLPKATIRVLNTIKGSITDEEGDFYLKNIPGNPIIVEYSYIGYKTQRDTLPASTENIEVEIKLAEEQFLADAVIVTATRVSPSAPVSHTNLSKEEISEMNTGRDVPYILNQTPSLVSSSDAGAGVGYTQLRIRGIDQNSINVTINGVAYNDAESQGVYWVNIPDFSSSLSDVQVQRGVGSSTNGPASFGASINMLTEGLNQKAYAGIGASYGSFNTLRTSLKFGSGILGKYWSIDGRLSALKSDGYIDRASSELFSYYLTGGFNNGKTSIKLLAFGGLEKTYQAWYGVDRATLETDRTFNFAGAKYDENYNVIGFHDNEIDHYQQDHFQLHLNHKFSPLWRAGVTFHYTYGRGYFEQFKQNDSIHYYNLTPADLGDTGIYTADLIVRPWLDNHFMGLTYNIEYSDDLWKMVLGGASNTYDGDHFGRVMQTSVTGDTELNKEYYRNNGFKTDVNSYFKLRRIIGRKFTAFFDLQHRYIEYSILGTDDYFGYIDLSRNYLFLNPKFGLTYNINSKSSMFYSIGMSNREPSRNDILFSDNFSASHEVLLDHELGYRISGSGFVFESNVFYMYYRDQLVPNGEINDVGEAIRENTGRSYRAGLELAVSVDIFNNLQWSPNITFSDNKNLDFNSYNDNGEFEIKNTSIALSPSLIANNALRYRALPYLSFTLFSSYVGEQYLDNNEQEENTLKAYNVHDLRVEFKKSYSWCKEASLFVVAYNILDAQYESFGYMYYGTPYFFPQAGRNFMAGLNVLF